MLKGAGSAITAVTPTFRNPVAVHHGVNAIGALAALMAGRRYVLVTTRGWVRRGLVSRIVAECGVPVSSIDNVPENPTLQYLLTLEPQLSKLRGSNVTVVALGGGSALDAAKAVAGALAAGVDMNVVCDVTRAAAPLPASAAPPPIVSVPTTSGTGSEVTKWATLWDGETGAKYSLSDDRLYSTAAILDPALTASQPDAVTLSSGIDALSHSLESIWNAKHNPISDAFASDAIVRIWKYLPVALSSPTATARAELQTAAMCAGMAISSTRTALAHSISYPLTGRFGLRHGLACGFTLPQIAAFTLPEHPDRAEVIARAIGVSDRAQIPATLRAWMDALGVYRAVSEVVDPAKVVGLGPSLLAPGRADNNLRPATAADAEAILLASLSGSLPSAIAAPPTAGRVFWITGLSGAGKSTLSHVVAEALRASGRAVVLLDGDEMRSIVGGRLGHSEAERRELANRYGALCRALSQQGIDVVCATMSLFHATREWNRANIARYVEVYVKVDLDTLVARDSKGLYAKALRGEMADVAGVNMAFEEPRHPDLVIDNSQRRDDFQAFAAQIIDAARGR